MSKMSEMESTIRELRDIASSINSIANWLTEAFGGSSDIPEEASVQKRFSHLKMSERFWLKSPVMASLLRSVPFC